MTADLQTYFEVLRSLRTLTAFYGVGAIQAVRDVAFQDTQLNVANLLSVLTRLILQKGDNTEVSLADSKRLKSSTAFQSSNNL